MQKRILVFLIEQIKIITRSKLLFFSMISLPLLIIFSFIYLFPLISDLLFAKSGFLLNRYYSVAAITLISMIPFIIGSLGSFMLLGDKKREVFKNDVNGSPVTKYILLIRMIILTSLSFIFTLAGIVIIGPVPSEGWLRTLYISFLLAIQSSFLFLYIGGLAKNIKIGLVLSKLYGLLLIVVPVGLIIHHPWNYFLFISPLYWISWAWVTPSPSESLLYGVISALITAFGVTIFFNYLLKKQTG